MGRQDQGVMLRVVAVMQPDMYESSSQCDLMRKVM